MGLKGDPGQLNEVSVTANLHKQCVSYEPFLSSVLRSIYTPTRSSSRRKTAVPTNQVEFEER